VRRGPTPLRDAILAKRMSGQLFSLDGGAWC
jgi:hypothetical protein